MIQVLRTIIHLIFIFSLMNNYVYALDIGANGTSNITSNSTTLQKFTGANATVNVSNSATLERANQPVLVNEQSGGTVTVESGSTISATVANTIQGIDSTNLTVTNSGTIQAGTSKAINLTDNEGARVTNNAGGIIKSDTNTISLSENDSDTVDDIIITNHGTIFATDNSDTSGHNVIKSSDTVTNVTINNEKGGHIYHGADKAVILLGGDATFNNSGKIENQNDPGSNVITLSGTAGATLNLKDSGLVIGKIKIDDSGHKINVQHGIGQSYFYETAGNGSYDIADLDGNPIVKGSVGSIGQGANEMMDEALGFKSLNFRKSLTRFKKSEQYSNNDRAWSEVTSSLNFRKADKSTLRLENNSFNIGANIIAPISNDKNFIIVLDTGTQKFSKDHDVEKIGLSTGFHMDQIKISENISTEFFIIGGIGFNKSDRRILTNTTTSGVLKITDDYKNYDWLIGNKIITNSALPDISFNLGYSRVPSHKESRIYEWEEKDIYNASVALSNEHDIIKNENSNLYFAWLVDARNVIDENTQVFTVNGTRGTYSQHSDLKEELSLSASINYEYKFSENNSFAIVFDGLQTSQDTSGVQANLNYSYKF